MEYKIEEEVLLSESEVKEQYIDYIDSNTEVGKKLIELLELNLNIRDDYLRFIMDVQPTSADQVRAILSPLKLQISEDNIKKILSIIKKHQQ